MLYQIAELAPAALCEHVAPSLLLSETENICTKLFRTPTHIYQKLCIESTVFSPCLLIFAYKLTNSYAKARTYSLLMKTKQIMQQNASSPFTFILRDMFQFSALIQLIDWCDMALGPAHMNPGQRTTPG